MALARLHKRNLIYIKLPIAIAAVLLMVWVWRSFLPLPPDEITLSAGLAEGEYYNYARQYTAKFAEHGIKVNVLESDGADQNLQRLRRLVTPHADLAFVQSKGETEVYEPGQTARLQSLGKIDIEPVWIFSRQGFMESLTQLQGQRVSLGPAGSGTRRVALALLEQAQIKPSDLVESKLNGAAAADALRRGDLDVMFWVSSGQSPLVRSLLAAPGIQLLQLRHAAALTERLRQLEPRLLPQSAIDPASRIPARDTVLLTTSASLVSRDDLNPALQRLAVQIASEIHSGGGLFHRAGDFPTFKKPDFPIATQARQTLAYGRPWLEQALPFWSAQILTRVLLICVPIALLALWLSALLPAYLRSLIESRVTRWYGELKYIELDLLEKKKLSGLDRARHAHRLDEMEKTVAATDMPDYLMERWYLLRVHINFVRSHLHREMGR